MNIVLLVLVLVVPFSNVGAAAKQAELTVSAPNEAYQGDEIFLKITASGGKGSGVYTVSLPKSIGEVSLDKNGQRISDQSTADDYIFSWSKVKGKNKSIYLTVKLTDQLFGLLPLVTVFRNGQLVFSKQIDVLVPELDWTTSQSATEVLKGEPFDWGMTISNSSNQVLTYNFEIEVWYTCIQINPIMKSSAVMTKSDQFNTIWSWQGSVNPGETIYMNIEMVTKPYVLSDCGVVKLKNNDTLEETIFYVNVLGNTQPPHGTMSFVPGQPGQLEIKLYSPDYTQFVMGPVTSTDCQFEGLPSGSTSGYPMTYARFVYGPTLISANGNAICHLETTFVVKYLSLYKDTYTVETEFVVE